MKNGNYHEFNVLFGKSIQNGSHPFVPIIPTLQYSSTPRGFFTAEPFISDLAQRTRFSITINIDNVPKFSILRVYNIINSMLHLGIQIY